MQRLFRGLQEEEEGASSSLKQPGGQSSMWLLVQKAYFALFNFFFITTKAQVKLFKLNKRHWFEMAGGCHHHICRSENSFALSPLPPYRIGLYHHIFEYITVKIQLERCIEIQLPFFHVFLYKYYFWHVSYQTSINQPINKTSNLMRISLLFTWLLSWPGFNMHTQQTVQCSLMCW